MANGKQKRPDGQDTRTFHLFIKKVETALGASHVFSDIDFGAALHLNLHAIRS